MPTRTLLAILLWLTAAPVYGQWHENGETAPDLAWRKADGPFGAMLLLTAKVDEFHEQWNRPAAEGYAPRIETVREARRGDVVAAVVLFTHCEADASGKCESLVDFKVLRPDGSTYADLPGVTLWREAAPGRETVQLGRDHLGFEIEPDDPLGVYEIHATAHDLTGGRSVALVQQLLVAGAPTE